jgi:hypothetical protein
MLPTVLVVAPGSLVDRWSDEMTEKFGLTFQILTKDLIDQSEILLLGAACGWLAWTSLPGRGTKMSASVFGSEV